MAPQSIPPQTGIRVPTTRRRECATQTVRGESNYVYSAHPTHKSLPWTRPPVRWPTRGRRSRRRRRSACTRAPPSAAAAATASSTAAQHHTRALAAVRPSVRTTERERSIWTASASCGRPSDIPEPLVSDAVTSYASRVHTLNRVIASYCASLPLRQRRLRRRRKESAPASGPDASKSGRVRARYR